jgi:hypothetical protein
LNQDLNFTNSSHSHPSGYSKTIVENKDGYTVIQPLNIKYDEIGELIVKKLDQVTSGQKPYIKVLCLKYLKNHLKMPKVFAIL